MSLKNAHLSIWQERLHAKAEVSFLLLLLLPFPPAQQVRYFTRSNSRTIYGIVLHDSYIQKIKNTTLK
jgi:hypothetical protein